MSEPIEIKVPDIGDFVDVDVIEVHVAAGDTVAAEDPLITLETDKAAMDIPAPQSGRIADLKIATGDKVSEGSVIATLEPAAADAADAATTGSAAGADSPHRKQQDRGETKSQSSAPAASGYEGKVDLKTGLAVIGAGVGGYAAAFRAADLGMDVTLIDRWATLGGVCLNVGCIPSKALLHAAKVIEEAEHMADHGVVFGEPEIDTEKLANWKDKVVAKLTGGLAGLAKKRKVNTIQGTAKFLSPYHLEIESAGDTTVVEFEQCVIAAGSEPARLPFQPNDKRVLDSTSALELKILPERMLVIGGGIIGLEMATVYAALGVKISIVELTDKLIPECDQDLVRPLQKRVSKRY
ncbi:MAG: FAD-dependent oxidoreductase, partial [Gammaproteobacteria bacterium]|nr:FAD-dependent oxidoreductase [Gammaproteobacteria bacterium]